QSPPTRSGAAHRRLRRVFAEGLVGEPAASVRALQSHAGRCVARLHRVHASAARSRCDTEGRCRPGAERNLAERAATAAPAGATRVPRETMADAEGLRAAPSGSEGAVWRAGLRAGVLAEIRSSES